MLVLTFLTSHVLHDQDKLIQLGHFVLICLIGMSDGQYHLFWFCKRANTESSQRWWIFSKMISKYRTKQSKWWESPITTFKSQHEHFVAVIAHQEQNNPSKAPMRMFVLMLCSMVEHHGSQLRLIPVPLTSYLGRPPMWGYALNRQNLTQDIFYIALYSSHSKLPQFQRPEVMCSWMKLQFCLWSHKQFGSAQHQWNHWCWWY